MGRAAPVRRGPDSQGVRVVAGVLVSVIGALLSAFGWFWALLAVLLVPYTLLTFDWNDGPIGGLLLMVLGLIVYAAVPVGLSIVLVRLGRRIRAKTETPISDRS